MVRMIAELNKQKQQQSSNIYFINNC